MNHITNALKQLGKRILWAIPVITVLTALHAFGFTRLEIISTFTLFGVAILIYILIIAGRQLGNIDTRLQAGFRTTFDKLYSMDDKLNDIRQTLPHKWLPKHNNPGNRIEFPWLSSEITPESKPPEDKPTGGGLFAGMLIGGAIGSAGGPVGTLVGGIIGALVGNQLEYENIQKKKRPPQ